MRALTLGRVVLLLSIVHLALAALSNGYFHLMRDTGGDGVTLTALAAVALVFVTSHVRVRRTREVSADVPARRWAIVNMYLSEAAALLLILLYVLALGGSFAL